ncbi:hypothetical protein [Nonomuraea sp. NPDC002799]
MSKSSDLPAFLASYGPSFARTAYLLTGDADKGRTLAVDALTTVCRRWRAIRWSRPADAVLRELYRRFLNAGEAPATGALAALPPKARVALVTQYHDGLDVRQAAAITGLWVAVLTQETREARDYLQATRPDLFTTVQPHSPAPDPAPLAPPPSAPLAPQPPPPQPETPQPSAPEQAAEPASWAAPWGTVAPAATPWAVEGRTWAATPPAADPATPDDPELRAALAGIAAEMPHTNLSEPVLRRVTRRRRVRTALWTSVSVGMVGALVALIAVSVNAMARNLDQLIADPTGYPSAPQPIPEAAPAKLSAPIRYAYPGYCPGTPAEISDFSVAKPCAQWRLTTTSGEEWRLTTARPAYDEATGASAPLGVSRDGHRLAYRNSEGAYVVHDLPSGKVKAFDVRDELVNPAITSSPNGRFFAVGSEFSDGGLFDFDTGVTHYLFSERVLAVRDDGTRLAGVRKDVHDVPGHASVTTLTLGAPGALEGGYRVDPDLLKLGGALAPDGRTVALIAEDSTLITMDARTGRVFGHRTVIEDYEVLAVERWVSADEVLIRQWDDDYAYLTKVNVHSGATVELSEDWMEELGYDSPIGALK